MHEGPVSGAHSPYTGEVQRPQFVDANEVQPPAPSMEANPIQISSAAAFQQNDLGNVEMQSQSFYGGPAQGAQPIMKPASIQPIPMQVDQPPQMAPQPQPLYQAPPMEQQEAAKKRDKKQQQENLDLLTFYRVAKRTLALELEPHALRFRGQITFDLELRDRVASPVTGEAVPLQQTLDYYKSQEKKKLHLEAKFLAKQVQVHGIYLLKDGAEGPKKLKFAEGSLHDPEEQAKQQGTTYQNLSRHLYQLEDV